MSIYYQQTDWWMPWYRQAMKDALTCEKFR